MKLVVGKIQTFAFNIALVATLPVVMVFGIALWLYWVTPVKIKTPVGERYI